MQPFKIFGLRAGPLPPLVAAIALLSAQMPAPAAPTRLAAVASRQTAVPRPQAPSLSRDIHAYVQPGLRDFTVTLKTGGTTRRPANRSARSSASSTRSPATAPCTTSSPT